MSSILGKAWLPAIAIFAVFAVFAFGGTKSASALPPESEIADIFAVNPVSAELYDNDGGGEDCEEADGVNIEGDLIHASVEGIVAFCVVISEDVDTVNVQVDPAEGEFLHAVCGNEDGDNQSFEHQFDANPATWDDLCEDQNGQFTTDLTVFCGDGADSDCDDGILFFYVCPDEAVEVDIIVTFDNDESGFSVFCHAEPDEVTVTARPTTVEIVPAIGSSAHSEITIVMTGDGLPVDPEDTEIDISVPKCAIEMGTDNPDSSPLTDNYPADSGADWTVPTAGPNEDKTVVDNIWFHADWNNCTPGDVVVTVTVEVDDGADIVRTVTIKVVGPPAFITATAAPTSLICGEKSTITVKVTDAIGQNVSDNTRVELISNWGSVIAGTGATLGFPGTGPVNPLASSAAATYQGVAIAYLLTSDTHTGSYEVVAAAGGTVGFDIYSEPGGQFTSDPYWNDLGSNGLDRHDTHSRRGDNTNALLYSGAPITTQVTVTCSQPAAPVAPTVTAPTTGTGSITPPNTGDAGLASSSSNAMLFVIVGAAAFVLAGIASVSYARR